MNRTPPVDLLERIRDIASVRPEILTDRQRELLQQATEGQIQSLFQRGESTRRAA